MQHTVARRPVSFSARRSNQRKSSYGTCMVPSPVGVKRVVLALTDVVVLTVHKTDKTVADGKLEEEMIETDALSKYDVNNQPKPGVLVCNSGVDTLEN